MNNVNPANHFVPGGQNISNLDASNTLLATDVAGSKISRNRIVAQDPAGRRTVAYWTEYYDDAEQERQDQRFWKENYQWLTKLASKLSKSLDHNADKDVLTFTKFYKKSAQFRLRISTDCLNTNAKSQSPQITKEKRTEARQELANLRKLVKEAGGPRADKILARQLKESDQDRAKRERGPFSDEL